MVGLLQLFILVGLWSCAHVRPDPHFWPGTSHQLRRVPATEISSEPVVPHVNFKTAPSLSHSEWRLVGKASFSQRIYRLTLRDEKNQFLDSPVPPQVLLEGQANLIRVTRVSPGVWDVKIEFTTDQSVIKVGLSVGGHRIDHFKQIHLNIHQVDVFNSQSFTHKKRTRADGIEALNVHVELKDVRGYTIYSFDDFELNISLSDKTAKVEGPFSGFSGPYFKVRSKKIGEIKYFVTIDGERLSGLGISEFVAVDSRRPAQENRSCLQDLADATGAHIPENVSLPEAYKLLVNQVLRRYEEKADLSLKKFESILDIFSSQKCTENRILDSAREEAGRELRKLRNQLNH